MLTEAQVKKVRKRALKDGTPCHHARCVCDNYDPPPGVARNSWLALCKQCKHTETEHRVSTKFDKQLKVQREKAADQACAGCHLMCHGFQQQDDSVPASSPLAKQCVNCKHTIDSHRPETEVDNFIRYMITSKKSQQCRTSIDPKDKGNGVQAGHIVVGETDDDNVLPWFQPTNVDPDELGKLLWMNKQCKCHGYSYGGDLARIFQTYHGLTKEIIAPHLPYLPCQQCNHPLKGHREPNDKENRLIEEKKKDHMTLSSVKSLLTTSTSQSQEAVGAYLMTDTAGSLAKMAIARVECLSGAGYSVVTSIIPVECPDEDHEDDVVVENGSHIINHKGSKKRGKIGGILEGMKQKIKKRKTEDGCVEKSDTAIENDHKPSPIRINAALVQGLDMLHQPQYATDINCGISEPTCLEWGTAIGGEDAEVSFKDDQMLTLAVGDADGTVVVFTFKDEEYHCMATEGRLDDESAVNRLAWHPGCNALFSGHTSGAVVMWNCALLSGEMMLSKVLRERKEMVTALAANKRFLSIGYHNGDIIFYELLSESSEEFQEILTPKLTTSSSNSYGSVTCIAWHQNKNIVACGGEDDNITVFHYHTLTDSQRRGSIRAYFSPRRLKKPNQFHKCCILKGHSSFVSSITFDPASNFLFSSGWDGQLFFWSTTEIDDIISSGDDVADVAFQSGFAIGQGQQKSQLSTAFGECNSSPFVPLQAQVHHGSVLVATRCCQDRAHLVLYETPKSVNVMEGELN